jgi:hypothetical protein
MAVFNSFIFELDLGNDFQIHKEFRTNKEAEGYSVMFLGIS